MVKMKKNMEELAFKKPVEANRNSKSSVQFNQEGSLLLMKKMRIELVKRKASVGKRLVEIPDYLSKMECMVNASTEERIGMLKSGRNLSVRSSTTSITIRF